MRPFGKVPFFSWPRSRLTEVIGTIADAIRSLPDGQLVEETEQLRVLCSQNGEHLPEHVLLALYGAEKERRKPAAVNAGQYRLFEGF